jgi:hypothetical protein
LLGVCEKCTSEIKHKSEGIGMQKASALGNLVTEIIRLSEENQYKEEKLNE